MIDYVELLRQAKEKGLLTESQDPGPDPVTIANAVKQASCLCKPSGQSVCAGALKSIDLSDLDTPDIPIVGIDSSSVGPDRHIGLEVGLVQTKAVVLEYASEEEGTSSFQEETSLDIIDKPGELSMELWAALSELRECLAWSCGLGQAVIFFDGSLHYILQILGQTPDCEPEADAEEATGVLADLEELNEESVLVCYSSATGSREVCRGLAEDPCLSLEIRAALEHMRDGEFFQAYLEPGQFCGLGLVKCGGLIAQNYYFKIPGDFGVSEIAKVELWTKATDSVEGQAELAKIALLATFDQVKKGKGYVRVLELAHNLCTIGEQEKFAVAQLFSGNQKTLQFSAKLQKKLWK